MRGRFGSIDPLAATSRKVGCLRIGAVRCGVVVGVTAQHVSGFSNSMGMAWGQYMAVGVIVLLPISAVALIFQRYLVCGLTFSACAVSHAYDRVQGGLEVYADGTHAVRDFSLFVQNRDLYVFLALQVAAALSRRDGLAVLLVTR